MPRTQSAAARQRSNELVWVRHSSSTTVAASSSASLIDFTAHLATALGENTRNWTIERILGNFVWSIPASTAAGRSYAAFAAIDIIEEDAATAGSFPEPFADPHQSYPWVDGRQVFADHTVPASYSSPGINGIFALDMRSKRRSRGFGQELHMFGYHDNGLSANPVLYYSYSALWRIH